MSHDLLTLLNKLPSTDDKQQWFEAMSIVTDDVSRRIIAKAASRYSPVSINEFQDISETTMVRHVDLLEHINILKPHWGEDNIRRSEITELGREIGKILQVA